MCKQTSTDLIEFELESSAKLGLFSTEAIILLEKWLISTQNLVK